MATSDDSEMAAIAHGITAVSHLLLDLTSIHVFSDSFNAMRLALDGSTHSACNHSLCALEVIQPWLDEFSDSKIVFHYICPGGGLPP
jgi:hypothetical protein